jgi:hypothetical protein
MECLLKHDDMCSNQIENQKTTASMQNKADKAAYVG